MHIVSVDKLYDRAYTVKAINAVTQYWRERRTFNCLGHPKKMNLFLYLSGCKARYHLSTGEQIDAFSGDVVYAPLDCEYSVRLFDFSGPESHTIGVNFYLFDETDTPFILGDKVTVFSANEPKIRNLFLKMDRSSEAAIKCPAGMVAAMYDLLTLLSSKTITEELMKEKYRIILPGINYLERDNDQNMSIREIARICSVSEIYFRRLFKEYAGVSPARFRVRSRIEKAKTYLEYEDMTVNEISEHLRFASPAYFIRQFKALEGITPLQYRKKMMNK